VNTLPLERVLAELVLSPAVTEAAGVEEDFALVAAAELMGGLIALLLAAIVVLETLPHRVHVLFKGGAEEAGNSSPPSAMLSPAEFPSVAGPSSAFSVSSAERF
jgi:hypothetical protein